jgi:hypothetical protein
MKISGHENMMRSYNSKKQMIPVILLVAKSADYLPFQAYI